MLSFKSIEMKWNALSNTWHGRMLGVDERAQLELGPTKTIIYPLTRNVSLTIFISRSFSNAHLNTFDVCCCEWYLVQQNPIARSDSPENCSDFYLGNEERYKRFGNLHIHRQCMKWGNVLLQRQDQWYYRRLSIHGKMHLLLFSMGFNLPKTYNLPTKKSTENRQ